LISSKNVVLSSTPIKLPLRLLYYLWCCNR